MSTRDTGMTPGWTCTDARLVRAGWLAAIMWHQGRSKCDGYGRLDATPDELLVKILPAWGFKGGVTEEAVTEARDALAREGLWHVYQVGGVTYAEYEDYDDDQQPSYLARRAAKPRFPDPPDRPELAAANRVRYIPKGERNATAPTAGAVRESDLSNGVPSPPQEPGAVLTAGEIGAGDQGQSEQRSAEEPEAVPWKQTEGYRTYQEVCVENGLEAWDREESRLILINTLRGVPDRSPDILIEVAKEAARTAGGSRSPGATYGRRIIENLPSTVKTREQARLYFEGKPDRASPTGNGGIPPGGLPPASGPRPLDPDHIE